MIPRERFDFRNITIFQTAFLGDVLLTFPMISAIKKYLKPDKISYVALPEMKNLVSANPYIDKFIPYDKKGSGKGFFGLKAVAAEIRNTKCDVIFVPHRSVRSAVTARVSGTKRRIGFDRSAGSFLWTDSVRYRYDVHEIERNLCLLEPLGINNPEIENKLFVPEEVKESVKKLKSRYNIKPEDKLTGIIPGSVWYTKRWPMEKYLALAKKLISGQNTKILIFGGKEDKELGSCISKELGDECLNFAGELSVLGSGELMRSCSAVVSNDCGGMHLAAMAGVRITAVFGSTIPQFGFYPWGKGHNILETEISCRPCTTHGKNECPEKHLKCMNDVSVDDVVD